MSGALDERDHLDLITTMLTAAVGDNRVYLYGQVPGSDGNPDELPEIYVLVSLERRQVIPRQAGRTNRTSWRLSVRYVGRTTSEAQWAGWKTATALNEQQITVAGITSTPFLHETTNAVAPDAGLYSGLVAYTYTL